MDEQITRTIDEARAKLEGIWETLTVGDFEFLHAKFFASVISIEFGFERRFPAEWAAYERKFYGDDVK